MSVTFVILRCGEHTENEGGVLELVGDDFTLGRADTCAVRTESDLVSRKHASLHFVDRTWLLSDLGSRNGTFLNTRRIETAELRVGDRIMLGEEGPVYEVLTLEGGAGGEESEDLEATRFLRTAPRRGLELEKEEPEPEPELAAEDTPVDPEPEPEPVIPLQETYPTETVFEFESEPAPLPPPLEPDPEPEPSPEPPPPAPLQFEDEETERPPQKPPQRKVEPRIVPPPRKKPPEIQLEAPPPRPVPESEPEPEKPKRRAAIPFLALTGAAFGVLLGNELLGAAFPYAHFIAPGEWLVRGIEAVRPAWVELWPGVILCASLGIYWMFVGFGLQHPVRRFPILMLLGVSHAAALYGPELFSDAAKGAEPAATAPSIEDKIEHAEKEIAALEREVARRFGAESASARTAEALDAIIARLDELAKNAGRLPADVVREQIERLERDFEMRELMAKGSAEVAEEAASQRTFLGAWRYSLQQLREEAKEQPPLLARLDAAKAALDRVEATLPKEKTGARTGTGAARDARARFDEKVTQLRARLG